MIHRQQTLQNWLKIVMANAMPAALAATAQGGSLQSATLDKKALIGMAMTNIPINQHHHGQVVLETGGDTVPGMRDGGATGTLSGTVRMGTVKPERPDRGGHGSTPLKIGVTSTS
jgi:hypothetical protein